MLDRLIQKSTEYLISRNVIDSDDRDVYEYGFHALYSNTLIFSVIGLISLLLHRFSETVVFLFAFIIMRNSAGGYHAKTQLRCFLMSTIIWLSALWVISNLSSICVTIGMALFSAVIVWIKAPIEHENNPLSEKKLVRMRFRSRMFSAVLLIIIVFICALIEPYMWIAVSLTIGMVLHSALFITALCLSR